MTAIRTRSEAAAARVFPFANASSVADERPIAASFKNRRRVDMEIPSSRGESAWLIPVAVEKVVLKFHSANYLLRFRSVATTRVDNILSARFEHADQSSKFAVRWPGKNVCAGQRRPPASD